MRIDVSGASIRDERCSCKTSYLRSPKPEDNVVTSLAQYLNAQVEPDANDIHCETAKIYPGIPEK